MGAFAVGVLGLGLGYVFGKLVVLFGCRAGRITGGGEESEGVVDEAGGVGGRMAGVVVLWS